MNNKILIVDDNPQDLELYKKILEQENRKILIAISGLEALNILLKEKGVSLILMDVHMPDMSGFDTSQLIKQRKSTSQIPILFISGKEMATDIINYGFEIGAYDYIFKPINPQLLKNKVNIFLTLYDQQKKLERQTRELKQSNLELSQFAYIASHDLKEPLRSVANFSQLLEQNYIEKLDKDANTYITFIKNSVYKMNSMINDLLHYSTLSTDRKVFETIDCNNIVKQAIYNLNLKIQEYEATINYPQLPFAQGDATQLIRLFQNLIDNALKYSGSEPPVINITFVESVYGKYIFCVQDNGIGLNTDFQEKIFQIFQRLHDNSKYSGSGMGLATCKKIVELHSGRIWVESMPGKGASFFFTIPKSKIKQKNR